MTSRIYVVQSRETPQSWLVRADNKSQAMRVIAEREYGCEVADQDTLVKLSVAGVPVLDARQPQRELVGPGGGLNHE